MFNALVHLLAAQVHKAASAGVATPPAAKLTTSNVRVWCLARFGAFRMPLSERLWFYLVFIVFPSGNSSPKREACRSSSPVEPLVRLCALLTTKAKNDTVYNKAEKGHLISRACCKSSIGAPISWTSQATQTKCQMFFELVQNAETGWNKAVSTVNPLIPWKC